METDREQYFISYNREDQDRIRQIIGFLMQKGVNIWWDKGLKPESEAGWAKQISIQMKHSKACILFITENIFTKEHSGVYREYEKAKLFHKNVIYVMLDDLNDDRVLELDENAEYTDFWIEIRKKHVIEGFKYSDYQELADRIFKEINKGKNNQKKNLQVTSDENLQSVQDQVTKEENPQSAHEQVIKDNPDQKAHTNLPKTDWSKYFKEPEDIEIQVGFLRIPNKKQKIADHISLVKEQLDLFEALFQKTEDVKLLTKGSDNLCKALEIVHNNNVLWKDVVDTAVLECLECFKLIRINIDKDGSYNDKLKNRISDVIARTRKILEML